MALVKHNPIGYYFFYKCKNLSNTVTNNDFIHPFTLNEQDTENYLDGSIEYSS